MTPLTDVTVSGFETTKGPTEPKYCNLFPSFRRKIFLPIWEQTILTRTDFLHSLSRRADLQSDEGAMSCYDMIVNLLGQFRPREAEPFNMWTASAWCNAKKITPPRPSTTDFGLWFLAHNFNVGNEFAKMNLWSLLRNKFRKSSRYCWLSQAAAQLGNPSSAGHLHWRLSSCWETPSNSYFLKSWRQQSAKARVFLGMPWWSPVKGLAWNGCGPIFLMP